MRLLADTGLVYSMWAIEAVEVSDRGERSRRAIDVRLGLFDQRRWAATIEVAKRLSKKSKQTTFEA